MSRVVQKVLSSVGKSEEVGVRGLEVVSSERAFPNRKGFRLYLQSHTLSKKSSVNKSSSACQCKAFCSRTMNKRNTDAYLICTSPTQSQVKSIQTLNLACCTVKCKLNIYFKKGLHGR